MCVGLRANRQQIQHNIIIIIIVSVVCVCLFVCEVCMFVISL